MYMALTAAYCGGALILAQLWVLPLLVLPLSIIQRIVEPYEERRMSILFGERYAHYCRQVRRWL